MAPRRILALVAITLVSGCGHQTDLKPAAGQSLPLRPLMARSTPTPEQLLTIPAYAKPDRVDELMKRSEPRPQDPFDLTPGTGGAVPSLPAGSENAPSEQNDSQPAPGLPATPPGD